MVPICEKSPDPKPGSEAEQLIALLMLQMGVRVLRRGADQKWGFEKNERKRIFNMGRGAVFFLHGLSMLKKIKMGSSRFTF